MRHRKSMKILMPDEYRTYWSVCPTFIPLSTFECHSACIHKTYNMSVQQLADRGGLNLIEAYLALHDLSLDEYEHVSPVEAVAFLKEVADRDWPDEMARRINCRRVEFHSQTCDFCASSTPWTSYQVDNGTHEIVAGRSLSLGGLWNACKECAEFIDTDQWEPAFLDRAVKGMSKHLADLPDLRDRLRKMHQKVRRNLRRKVA
jgi:hypothetical protein